jgi:hypothetical protein
LDDSGSSIIVSSPRRKGMEIGVAGVTGAAPAITIINAK